jgi:hypothetical protein
MTLWLRVIQVGVFVAVATGAEAQSNPTERSLVVLQQPQQSQKPINAGVAFLGSAVVPGAGQFLLGEERWVPYIVAEAWAWFTYFAHRHDARVFASRYRDLGWSVARRVSLGARRDTIFEYYEALSHWPASGALDMDPQAAGIQPEADTVTFNGDVWRLARALYIPGDVGVPVNSPEYQRALAYYVENAIPPGYAWAWGVNVFEQQVFNDLIASSDAATRAATLRLGIILANHLVSAIDALVLARLRDARGAPLRFRLGSDIDMTQYDWRWTAGLHISW